MPQPRSIDAHQCVFFAPLVSLSLSGFCHLVYRHTRRDPFCKTSPREVFDPPQEPYDGLRAI